MRRKLISEVITIFLVGLFVYVAVSKLLDYKLFAFQLQRSPYIYPYATLLSFCLPVAELLIAALLIAPATRLTGLYGSLLLMSLFTSYVYLLLNYSDHIPCSCGGVISLMSWKQHLLFNCIVTVLNIVAIYCYPAPVKRHFRLAESP